MMKICLKVSIKNGYVYRRDVNYSRRVSHKKEICMKYAFTNTREYLRTFTC